MLLLFIAAEVTGVSVEDIKGHCRVQHISEARHIASYALHKFGGMTYSGIGIFLGNRHHTSVMHSVKVVEYHMEHGKSYPSMKFKDSVTQIERTWNEVWRQRAKSLTSSSVHG